MIFERFERLIKKHHVLQWFLSCAPWPVMTRWWMMLYAYTWKMLFSSGETHGFEKPFKKSRVFQCFLRCTRLQIFSTGGISSCHDRGSCHTLWSSHGISSCHDRASCHDLWSSHGISSCHDRSSFHALWSSHAPHVMHVISGWDLMSKWMTGWDVMDGMDGMWWVQAPCSSPPHSNMHCP